MKVTSWQKEFLLQGYKEGIYHVQTPPQKKCKNNLQILERQVDTCKRSIKDPDNNPEDWASISCPEYTVAISTTVHVSLYPLSYDPRTQKCQVPFRV